MTCTISMSTLSLGIKVNCFCHIDLMLEGRKHHQSFLSVLPKLCADFILGLNFLSQDERVYSNMVVLNPLYSFVV